jgi:hypothetical protein
MMTDDEIEAARTAPLSAPNEELKQHIVNRTRAALSDANQGQRVCAVCDECVFKNESRLGPFCQSVERSLQQRCSATRQQPPLDVTLISQYDCSNVHRGFEGVLLSRTAFETARCEVERANTSVADLPCVCGKQSHSATVYNVPMSICNSCASSLMRNNSNDNNDDDDDDSRAAADAPTLTLRVRYDDLGEGPPSDGDAVEGGVHRLESLLKQNGATATTAKASVRAVLAMLLAPAPPSSADLCNRTKAFGNALLTNRSPLAHTIASSAQFDLHATAVIEAAGELLAVDPAPPVLGRCACLVDTLLAHKASAVVNLLKFALPSSITSIGTPSS